MIRALRVTTVHILVAGSTVEQKDISLWCALLSSSNEPHTNDQDLNTPEAL